MRGGRTLYGRLYYPLFRAPTIRDRAEITGGGCLSLDDGSRNDEGLCKRFGWWTRIIMGSLWVSPPGQLVVVDVGPALVIASSHGIVTCAIHHEATR